MTDLNKENINKINIFIKNVAKYFMDFLESDFHKHRKPNRKVIYREKSNLLVGQRLDSYPTFQKLITESIKDGFNGKGVKRITKGVYKRSVPKSFMDKINRLIKDLGDNDVQKLRDKILSYFGNPRDFSQDIYEIEDQLIEGIKAIIKEHLTIPFVNKIKTIIQSVSQDENNNLFIIEDELTNNIFALIEEFIPEIISSLTDKNKPLNKEDFKNLLSTESVKSVLISFFESMHTADLFEDVSEMNRNLQTLEKQEFYLYFYDLSYEGITYPIFYIPFNLVEIQNEKTYEVEFDSQVYINKKALEYLAQEYNSDSQDSQATLKEITNRIIYLAEYKDNLPDRLNSILNEIVSFFKLDKDFDLNDSSIQKSKSLLITASNSCYIAIFDKSDEALVNDYEDILKLLELGDSKLSEAFIRIIEDFIYNNPVPFEDEVEQEWEDTYSSDKLIFQSPIPLNSEQRQIVNALQKDGCNYISVEGPPGTGKSHTITSIVFNAILKEQSVLVLSDKKEALDVVESKISDSMNKARPSGDFQNPILRLGKTGNTYKDILSRASVEKIKNYHKALKKHNGNLEDNIIKLEKTLKEDFEAESLSYSDIDIGKITEYYNLQKLTDEWEEYVDLQELLNTSGSAEILENVNVIIKELLETLLDPNYEIYNTLKIETENLSSINDWTLLKQSIDTTIQVSEKVLEIYPQLVNQMVIFDAFSYEDLTELREIVREFNDLKTPIIGFLFKKKDLAKVDLKFKKTFNTSLETNPSNQLSNIEKALEIFNYFEELIFELQDEYPIDPFTIFHYLFAFQNSREIIGTNITDRIESFEEIFKSSKLIPETFTKIGLDQDNIDSIKTLKILNLEDRLFNKLLRYISLFEELVDRFNKIPSYNYILLKQQLEELVTTKMTYLMDERLIDFDRNYKADRIALGKIIQSKQKFPKDDFLKLKNAFPCILAGIRDYAEYIPLESNIFDLVIIDEASQVSIAQAFPALLRAKKVLVLGDRKQFPNVKSSQAKGITNQNYLNVLEKSFRENISSETKELTKLKNFNIRTSILEFFDSINNYNSLLKKHFRSYKEIISYSNKYFYGDELQVMKIRGKHIDEVLKFTVIENPDIDGLITNTNRSEVKAVIQELEKLHLEDSNQSIGIITPHTNQRKLFIDEIDRHPYREYFFEKLKLKIMTFDTCQGEERDIIFYSMVASKEKDGLSNIFIKDLETSPEGSIRKSRLNVGFSRAKETMHFFISKPIEEFKGSIGLALRHYHTILEKGKNEPQISEVDPNSPMEEKILHWLTQTEFWQNNFPDKLHLKPQFEIGKYLKQLDDTNSYNHPNYVVDFLMLYKDENNNTHKIIIEYDGFKEHFSQIDEINELNYSHYYSEDDVYRQKILESYGYKFLRLNKFNLGENPIKTIDTNINELVKISLPNNFLNQIQADFEALESGEMRECPKCETLREVNDFLDSSLVGGVGRICNHCKGITNGKYASSKRSCPKCGSAMILRSGPYGRFYGCSRYPNCKGTRRI